MPSLALLLDRVASLSPDFVLFIRLLTAFIAVVFINVWWRIYSSPKEQARRRWEREARRRYGD